MNHSNGIVRSTFTDLMHDRTLFTFVLSLIIILSATIMVLSGREVPDWYQLNVGLVIGFFFATKGNGKTNSKTDTQELKAVK